MESSKGIKISMCNLVSFKSLFINSNSATESTHILLIQHYLNLQPPHGGTKKESERDFCFILRLSILAHLKTN